ncbi:MAG: carboxypeptidase-like regulatory domain-containing protein [Thermoplasmata archaeon]
MGRRKLNRCLTPCVGVILFLGTVMGIVGTTFNASGSQPADIVVEDSKVLQINSNYVLTGNIYLKDNGVLVVSYSSFKIQQSYDFQYSIVATGNSRMIMIFSNITSSARMNILIKDNASLLIESSSLIFAGNLTITSINSGSMISNSTIQISNLTVMAPALTITSTELKVEKGIFDVTQLSIQSCELSSIIVSSGYAKIYSSTVYEISATNEGKVELYRTLSVEVRDRVGMLIPGANVNAYRNLGGNISGLIAHGTSDHNGKCALTLLTEIFEADNLGPVFYGNYLLNVSFGNLSTLTYLSFIPYEKGNLTLPEEIIHVVFSEIIMGDMLFTPQSNDLHLIGNQHLKIENNSQGLGFAIWGNIFLENNATITVQDAGVALNSSIIVMKDKTEMQIKNSFITTQAIIYVMDDAGLVLQNATLSSIAIVLDNGKLEVINSSLNASIYGKNSEIYIQGSRVNSEKIEIFATNTSTAIENSDVNAPLTSFILNNTHKFYLSNVSFKGSIDFVSSETIKVYNVTYETIHTYSQIELLHYIDVQVTNGNNRSVPNATAKLYRYEGANLKEEANGTTNASGRVIFSAIAKKIMANAVEFVGNYWLIVTCNGSTVSQSIALLYSTSIVAHFVQPVIPPLEINIQTNIPASGHINETVTISGVIFYNHGPETVGNATVLISIPETGEHWNCTADSDGRFAVQINLPLKLGNYKVIVQCFDPVYGLQNNTTANIEVIPYTYPRTIWEEPSVVYGTSTLVVVVILALLILAVKYINRKRVPAGVKVNEKREKDLIGWAVETMHKTKER